jgi:putative membrane-bound dehydrogenase-like protein
MLPSPNAPVARLFSAPLAFLFLAGFLPAQVPAPAVGTTVAPAPAGTPAAVVAPAVAAPPASPEPEIVPTDLFTVPEGFEVTLWARSPMLRNPTNMDIDAQGRIWITEGVNYRRHITRETAGDRVVVLEDTDGDGRADKSSVFVQEPGMIAPLGIAVIDNQVIVSNTPDLIVYTDVDRDGKFDPRVDKRDVLLTGFNGKNHDHSLHSVTFGPDGRWYFNQGNSSAYFTDRSGKTFRIGSAYEPRESGALPLFSWKSADLAGAKSDDGHVYVGGFAVRMKPDGTNVEIIGHGFRNSYEQSVTSFGDVFQSDNDDPPACRTTFLLEYGNAGFFSRDGSRLWNADKRPGQNVPTAEWRQEDPGTMPSGDVYGGGAPTGVAFNEGDALGEKYRGLLLACDAGRNTIYGYLPRVEGAGYTLERFNFLTTNKEEDFAGTDFKGGRVNKELKTYFRPADAVVGPDGAIYVADWFDARVGGHQDLDNGTNGAIYRIAPKGFKSVIPKFDLATTAGQIAALKSPAVNTRALGYNRLRTQGATAIPAVSALLTDANPYLRARAIWLLAELGPDGLGKVEVQLSNADPLLRITAFRALRRVNHRVLVHAKALANDSSPAVRREVALALRDVPFAEARDLLLTLARSYDGRDRFYLEAWGTGCSGKEAEVYGALAATQIENDATKWTPAYANLVWRLTPAAAVKAFAARAAAPQLTEAERLAATTALGFIPTRDAAFALLDLAQKGTGLVKSHALWWVLNYKDSRWQEHGLNVALKERGLYDAETVAVVPSVVPVPEPIQLPPVAEIAQLKGDATRGAGLGQACYLCHHIGDKGTDYAPALTGFAKRQTTEATITALVNPSADIANGYDGREITLQDGSIVHGLVLSSGDPLVVQSTGGLTQMIPAARVASQRPLRRSLMLSAEQLGLKAQDVADVVAWLKTQ